VILFSLGLFCWDDYQEVLLMAAHGRGFGALKVLRGMYERTVTLAYLHKNPDESFDFYLYEHIRNFTMANELKQSLGRMCRSARSSCKRFAPGEMKSCRGSSGHA
jgi:hypothetical protein